MSLQIGLVLLFAGAAIVMAICALAGKGGPAMIPVAVILLGLLEVVEHAAIR
jgi:hypothetical protein